VQHEFGRKGIKRNRLYWEARRAGYKALLRKTKMIVRKK
jgi:hypothetical protein